MFRKFADVIDMRYRHVIKSNCNYFIIFLILVDHSHNPNNFSFDQTKRLNSDTTNNQNIEWILVFAVCSWNKPIICRVMDRTEKNSVHFKKTWFLIELILYIGIYWDLNDCINNFRSLRSIWYIVPRILCEFLLHNS